MLLLFFAFLIVLALLSALAFLLGFRLGGDHWENELTRVRMQSAQAERELHDMTRQAFIAMAEHADGKRGQIPDPSDEA